MRILVLNWQDRRHPQAGGAEVHLHEVFGRLAGRGHEVVLVCSGWRGAPRRERLDGMEVYRVGSRWTYPLHVRERIRGLAAERPFDVVVEDLNKVPLFTPRWAPGPVVLVVHHLFGASAFGSAPLPVAALTWLGEQRLGAAYRTVPVAAVSASTRADLERHGFAAECIRVVPNGVDAAFFTPDADGCRAPEPLLVYVGRLVAAKRVDIPVRATALLRARGVPVTLAVAGLGPEERRLRRLARRLGAEGAIRFLGYVSEERKRELYRRAWLNVLTSRKEGWGLGVMEAAACGTPTVGSSVPGLWDAVRTRETGVLLPHGDVVDFAGEVGRLLADRPCLERMGRSARARAVAFSWECAAAQIEALLLESAAR